MNAPQAAVVHVASPRPFSTYYYKGRYKPGDWSRIGRAASLHGAVRAALRHLLEGTAQHALVHGEGGVVVARLTRDGSVIRIVGII